MTTLEHLQQNDLLPMELPLTLLPEDSRAKTLALLESKLELAKERVADCGASAYVLLAKYDPNTQSLRTSQTCLLAQVTNQGGGLAQYSATWPNAGIMRNGEIYQRGTLDCLMAGREFGLLPTPLKSDLQAKFSKKTVRNVMKRAKQEHLCYRPIMLGWDRLQTVTLYETVMGFPNLWVASMLSATP